MHGASAMNVFVRSSSGGRIDGDLGLALGHEVDLVEPDGPAVLVPREEVLVDHLDVRLVDADPAHPPRPVSEELHRPGLDAVEVRRLDVVVAEVRVDDRHPWRGSFLTSGHSELWQHVAGHAMPRTGFLELRLVHEAALLGERAAGVEATTCRHLVGRGQLPSQGGRSRARADRASDAPQRSAAVYGWRGRTKTSSVGPSSTIAPRYMIATRRVRWAMTASWWEMNRMAMPESTDEVLEEVEDLGLDGDVERADRLVGEDELGARRRGHERSRRAGAGRLTARAAAACRTVAGRPTRSSSVGDVAVDRRRGRRARGRRAGSPTACPTVSDGFSDV